MKQKLNAAKKAIWIDLDNSPHVPLFVPIIRHYRASGVDVILTARDHSQTIELLNFAGLQGTFFVVGRHYGKNKFNKIRGLISRTLDLVFLRNADVAVAISHGSRSMVLAALGLRIPVLTMYDYEYTETRIFNKLSDKVLVPDRIPDSVLDEIGLAKSKRIKYPGIKEELYVRNFRPVDGFRARLFEKRGIAASPEEILVVLRPPATTANYHSRQSEILFEAILQHLIHAPGIFTVIVPRTHEQSSEIREWIATTASSASNYHIMDAAVDGLDLIFAADLLISGGGTMNREAALLGVPVYSIFGGKQGALDAQMEREGAIVFIRNGGDIAKIVLQKRKRDDPTSYSNALTDRVERFVIDQIDTFLEAS